MDTRIANRQKHNPCWDYLVHEWRSHETRWSGRTKERIQELRGSCCWSSLLSAPWSKQHYVWKCQSALLNVLSSGVNITKSFWNPLAVLQTRSTSISLFFLFALDHFKGHHRLIILIKKLRRTYSSTMAKGRAFGSKQMNASWNHSETHCGPVLRQYRDERYQGSIPGVL